MNGMLHRASKMKHTLLFQRHYRSNASTYGNKWDVETSTDTEETTYGQKFKALKDTGEREVKAIALINAFRKWGHKASELDLLKLAPREYVVELDLKTYGLNDRDLLGTSASVLTYGKFGKAPKLHDLIQYLQERYCGEIAAEFDYLESAFEREWFAESFEKMQDIELPNEEKVEIAKLMLKCQNFDHYLASKFATIKRYGGEGAESMMAFFHELFSGSVDRNFSQVVLCMPHRGRLNLLTTMLHYPAVIMFQKMRGKSEFPADVQGLGDVLSHLTASVDLRYPNGAVHLTMIPNPSHLEANNPVAVGKARGRMQTLRSGDYSTDSNPEDNVLCVQVHGDASMVGQGVVPETSALSAAPNFRVGGSIHLTVNNQIGFTTEANRARSTRYCTDVAKMTSSPVIHVNGDKPELLLKATRLALDYRKRFRKDVFIDLVCFRRWGHNELDDPSFTQPLMYDKVVARRSIPDIYADELVSKVVSDTELKECVAAHSKELTDQYAKIDSYIPQANHLKNYWSGFVQAPKHIQVWDTGVDALFLRYIGMRSVTVPESFHVHPHLKKTHCEARMKKLEQGSVLDWATAEAMAIGSLLAQGIPVRISGQDVGRATFSHRHAMLVDRTSDEIHIPLNDLDLPQQAYFEVANSILSEEAVLGFEYGMAVESPHRLVIWEAQFGDFFNGAQIIIDTFITGGESKWLLQNGLVMLLPHGYDGAGPEHSSCRIERFLQQCDSTEDAVDGANVNMEIVHPTTSAQYFHLLRRQIVRNYRKPLIVIAPKILLRLPAAASALSDMQPGTYFQPVLADNVSNAANVKRIIFVSGKHFYACNSYREANKITNCAIVRLESLCPFPADEVRKEIMKYPNANSFTWSQEEPRNMGPWFFVRPRFENIVGIKLRYAGRPELPIPAVAVGEMHQKQHEDVLKSTFIK